MTNEKLRLRLSVERSAALPPPVPVPWLSMVDTSLNRYLDSDTGRPFWIDSSSNPALSISASRRRKARSSAF